MYAGEPGPSYSQGNTKSCIQALLRNREQQSTFNKSSTNNPGSEPSFNNNCSSSNYTHLESAPPNFEFSPGHLDANEVNCPENL